MIPTYIIITISYICRHKAASLGSMPSFNGSTSVARIMTMGVSKCIWDVGLSFSGSCGSQVLPPSFLVYILAVH